MSKFQLPTQKGTEAFPQEMRAPTAVRFEGVQPGSPLARELYKTFAGPINQFHRAQAQKYSLSTIENYRAHTSTPELQMTYTNLQGSETLQIKVRKEVVEELEKKGRPWDWVVIDFHVPGINTGPGSPSAPTFNATRVRPEPEALVGSFGPWEDERDPPMFAFPDPNTHPYVQFANPADNVAVLSLRIDLRKHQAPGQSVAADLAGGMSRSNISQLYSYSNAPGFDPRTYTESILLGTYDTEDNPGAAGAVWPYAGDERLYGTLNDGHVVLVEDAPLPLPSPTVTETDVIDPLFHHEENIVLDPTSGIPQSSVAHSGRSVGIGGTVHELYDDIDYIFYYPVEENYASVPGPAATAVCTLRFTPGFGKPPEDILSGNTPGSVYLRWSPNAEAERLFGGSKLGERTISTETFNSLGRVVINAAAQSIGLSPAPAP